jgi:hypothetical protein
VCRAVLNKKNRSMAQSFLRLLIQFAGIAKLHLGKLSWRIRFVICLFRILAFPRRALSASGLPARAALARPLPGSADGLCCA